MYSDEIDSICGYIHCILRLWWVSQTYIPLDLLTYPYSDLPIPVPFSPLLPLSPWAPLLPLGPSSPLGPALPSLPLLPLSPVAPASPGTPLRIHSGYTMVSHNIVHLKKFSVYGRSIRFKII